MKKKYFNLLLLAFIPFYCFCQQKQTNTSNKNVLIVEVLEDGKIEDGKYKCNLFDWQIEIPSDFTITSKERIKQLEDKGYEAMKENSSEGKNISPESRTLISFEKDKYNTFAATYETLEGKKKMSFEEYKSFMFKLLQETYSRKGMKFDIVNNDVKLGKYDFNKILVHLYHPKTGELFYTQEIYFTIINNHLYTGAVSYLNENLGAILTQNFIKSFK